MIIIIDHCPRDIFFIVTVVCVVTNLLINSLPHTCRILYQDRLDVWLKCIVVNYFAPLFLASTLNVACGTAIKRSLGMSLPVSRHIPYVLFSIRTRAACKC